MSTDTASWFIVMFYLMVGGVGAVCGTYLIYWMAVELPVLLRIKREELYNRWRD
jgi:hypothetical protein|tara:strand:+ start:740 stop:901 length:162 start_codon:yes stop_codon:yes gene_type:complete